MSESYHGTTNEEHDEYQSGQQSLSYTHNYQSQYSQQPQYSHQSKYDQRPQYEHGQQYDQQSPYASQHVQQSPPYTHYSQPQHTQQWLYSHPSQYSYPSQYERQLQYSQQSQYDQLPQYSQQWQQHDYLSPKQTALISDGYDRNDSITNRNLPRVMEAAMPDPLDYQTRAAIPNLIEGTPSKGWYELLDSSYRMRTGLEAKQYFRIGRVFAMLYSEAASERAARRGNDNDAITVVRFGGTVYSQIRRFVVVSVKHGYVGACAISTYAHRGVLRPGCYPPEHTIMYAQGLSPTYIDGEIDAGMVKEPIEVIPADDTVTINPLSRIRLGKVYPIEWNVKVKDIGQVHPEHISKLLYYWKSEYDGESLEPEKTISVRQHMASNCSEESPRLVGEINGSEPSVRSMETTSTRLYSNTVPSGKDSIEALPDPTQRSEALSNIHVAKTSNTVADTDANVQLIPFEEDSDGRSDISDVSSIFSSTSLVSLSSAGSLEDNRQSAAQQLACMLFSESSLRPLYIQALQQFTEYRFSKNHDRLLKRFLVNIRSEKRDHAHTQGVRFLQSHSKRKQMTEEICQLSQQCSELEKRELLEQHPDQNKEEREEEEEEEETEGEEEDGDEIEKEEEEDRNIHEQQHDRQAELELAFASLCQGRSFEAFKSSLHSLVNPPRSIEDAVSNKNIDGLRRLLRNQFDLIAQGDYAWLRQLDDFGYTRDELATLLIDQAIDTPWIYFESETFHFGAVPVGRHLSGCAHQSLSGGRNPIEQSVTLQDYRSTPRDWRDVIRTLEELCGLAGITPSSRDSKVWIGSVRFEDQNSGAAVTYSRSFDDDNLDDQTAIHRMKECLERFCLAAVHVQEAELCCDSFTILRSPTPKPDQQSSSESLIEMCQIEFTLASQMLTQLKKLSVLRNIGLVDTLEIQEITSKILKPLAQEAKGTALYHSTSGVLNTCALAIQFLSLGFLSYSQAHTGEIRPFFLDTPLKKIQLLGNRTNPHEWIEASLNTLTCIGDMLQSPVLTFGFRPQVSYQSADKLPAYNLLGNAQDLLDTWGPGHFLVHAAAPSAPSAIRLGDGIIFTSDLENDKYHWSRAAPPYKYLSRGKIDPRKKITIGIRTPVVVNGSCIINERECWTTSSTFLEPLGPYDSYWEFDERQVGFQGGQYFVFQGIAGSHKRPGQTIKQHRLNLEDEALIPFLDQLWGVQVSFCTRVARRVPLREMIADLLPTFTKAYISSQLEAVSWNELETTHDIIGVFHQGQIQQWLKQLPEESYRYVIKMVRRIFDVVQHTGLDRDGKHLRVAWPHELDVHRCFKVPCEKESSWAGILADSSDCATYAYVSAKCLETETIKCSGPKPTWKSSILLLETEVVLQPQDSSLQHNQTYFFQKLDSLFFVRVQRPNTGSTACLITMRNRSPMTIQRRILVLMENRKRLARLREKIASYDKGEQVAVSQ